MPRTIAIGDIHGSLRALEQLMKIINPVGDDEFVFLGDYVDGWPDSAQVVEYLVALREKHHCTFIKGNHDVWCELWLLGNKPDSIWLQHGGRATIESYQHVPDSARYEHLEFFAKLENYMVDEKNRLFIHAGYATLAGPEYEFLDGKYSWDRTLWEMALKLESRGNLAPESYPPKFRLYNEIYIGHTPTIFNNIDTPVHALNLFNVDTGAGFDGRLSAIDIDNGTLWQSDPVPVLYPGMNGRTR